MPVEVETGRHIPKNPERFVFDEEVTQVFDNMALRSLPLYSYANRMITRICNQLQFEPGQSVWDFGASTGTGLIAAKAGIREPLVDFYGVDVSEPMLAKMSDKFPLVIGLHHDFEVTGGIPKQVSKTRPKVAIWNWTLQFLADEGLRSTLIRETYDALEPGGALILCEKWSHAGDADTGAGAGHDHTRMLQQEYLWWRRENGYSAEEIMAKSKALAGAMYPWSRGDAISHLKRAGFRSTSIFGLYQMFNFGGLVAYK